MTRAVLSHLLVPIDGSEPSRAAVALAARFARENGSIVTFCHVIAWVHARTQRVS
jgi:nucleotide-binding universal stress UspA family protein